MLLETALRPTRRGDLRAVGATVRLWGPFGLAARQRTRVVEGALRSLPPFESRKHLPSRLQRLRELDGRSAVRIRGQGTEFDSLREYVRGDDVRSIDWRASARNRNVVVRTWQPERDRRVVLVLDTSRTSAGRVDDVPRLDSAMDAALLLAALAARAGDRIDFIAGDRRVRTRLRSAGARDVAATLQDAMAGLQPVIAEADWTGLASAVSTLGRQRALVVLLTPLEPSAVEEGLLPVLPTLTRHHRVVLASVKDPALGDLAGRRDRIEEVYDAAAAEQVLHRRRHTAAMLGHPRRGRRGRRRRAAPAGAGRPLPDAEVEGLAVSASRPGTERRLTAVPEALGLAAQRVTCDLSVATAHSPSATHGSKEAQAAEATLSSSRAASMSPVWPRRYAARPSPKT